MAYFNIVARKLRTDFVLKYYVLGEEKGKVAQTMCIHVSKCKNDKIKGEKKKIIKYYAVV
jgi:hypothetical protein